MKDTVLLTSFLVHNRNLHLASIFTYHPIINVSAIVSQARLTHGSETNRYRKYNSSLGQVLRNYVCHIPWFHFSIPQTDLTVYRYSLIKSVGDL